MNPALRIFLFVIALVLLYTVLDRVSKKKLLVQYSLLWLFLAFGFIIVALFPNIVISLSELVGIQIPVNFVNFVGVIGLLFLNLKFAQDISTMKKVQINTIQEEAICKYLEEEEHDRDN